MEAIASPLYKFPTQSSTSSIGREWQHYHFLSIHLWKWSNGASDEKWSFLEDRKTGGDNVAEYSTHVDIDTLPPITHFTPPTPRNKKAVVDLSQFSHIVPFGDSMMQGFMAPLNIEMPRFPRPLNTSTVSEWISRFLVVSRHAWDLLEMSNTASHADHGQAIRQFTNHARTTYPNVTLVWKSPTVGCRFNIKERVVLFYFYIRLIKGAGVKRAGVMGAGVTGAGVMGAGVMGAGVTGAGVMGAGVIGAGEMGAGVTGAGVMGAGVMGAGVMGAGVMGAGVTGAGVMGAGVTGAGGGGGGGGSGGGGGGGPEVEQEPESTTLNSTRYILFATASN
jgi:hypothetical protein